MALVTRAAPIRKVRSWKKEELTAAEVYGTAFNAADFEDFYDNTVRHKDGQSTGTYALYPDFMHYPLFKVVFSRPLQNDGDASDITSATLALWMHTAETIEDDTPILVGTSEYANGAFPAISEVFNQRARWYLSVHGIVLDDSQLNLEAFLQPYYSEFTPPGLAG